MTFHEMLEKYKDGTLGEEERVALEREIEKYEAISDYLMETEEIPELAEVFGELEKEGADNGNPDSRNQNDGKRNSRNQNDGKRNSGNQNDGNQNGWKQDHTGKRADVQFVEVVNRSIRRAFRRLASAVLALTLAVVLFLQFCLPRIVSSFYYDPSKDTGAGQNQMSMDLAVYSELFWPGRNRTQVNAEAKGYGKYDISIPQTVSYNRSFTNVSGEIVRGKLKLYDTNVLKAPTGNCFAWFQATGDLSRLLTEIWGDGDADAEAKEDTTEEAADTGAEEKTAGIGDDDTVEIYNVCAAGTRQQARETLESLSDTEKYIGCVSLNRMMGYEDFMEWLDSQEELGNVWCAVKTNDPAEFIDEETGSTEQIFRADNIGFVCDPAQSTAFIWDEERYPELFLWNTPLTEDGGITGEEGSGWREAEKKLKTEENARQHFISLLTYMADQEEFLDMMQTGEGQREELLSAADYVRENGVTVYGFAAVMDKETALKLEEMGEVYEIYIEDLR